MSRPPERSRTPPQLSRVDTLPEHFIKALRSRLPELGEVVGERYRLERSLGRGAMGQVFVAENLAIGRKVAIKVLQPLLLADAEFRTRFQHEAEAVASIEHPNVARFFDLVVGDPTFLVMEYVPGETLSAVLKRDGKLDVARAVKIAIRLCWALDAAHTVGVIHRDLKPGNIILAPDVEQGETPKLIDFGLAKRVQGGENSSLTRDGQIIGTPGYMSPEQVSGKQIDPRSDIYSLGCVLYELVAGRPPFQKDRDDMQVLYQQVHDRPDPPSLHRPDLPRALDLLVQRALEKDPAQRPASMRQLAAALEECLTSTATAVRVPAARSTVALAAAAAGLLGVVAGVGAAFWSGHRRGSSQGEILVISRPAGGAVEVDGKKLEEATPMAARGLGAGPHVVRVQRAGLAPVEQYVKLGAGERITVDVTLPPTSHWVEVRTVPPGATIYLDGRLVGGDTPLQMPVLDDDFHEVRIEKTGFETEIARLAPEDHEAQKSYALEPEKQPRGLITIDDSGVSEVWIDGAPTGFSTPTLALRVGVGEHTVELRDASGGRSAQAHVTVKRGETVHLTLNKPSREGP